MITLHFHLQLQYKFELFHIYFTVHNRFNLLKNGYSPLLTITITINITKVIYIILQTSAKLF